MPKPGVFPLALLFVVACSQAEEIGVPSKPEDKPAGTSSSSATSASSSSGETADASSMAACDDAGSCGDYVSGCTGCAVLGSCSAAYGGCFGDASCLDFNKCLVGCGDDAVCRQACATANPVGAERYGSLVTCIVCQACPSSCADFTDFCL